MYVQWIPRWKSIDLYEAKDPKTAKHLRKALRSFYISKAQFILP